MGSIGAMPNYLGQIPPMDILPFLFLAFILYLAGVQLLGVQDCTGGLYGMADRTSIYITGSSINTRPVMMMPAEKEDIGEMGEDNVSEPFMKTNNAQLEGVLQAAVPLS